jgi:hypothetical protein
MTLLRIVTAPAALSTIPPPSMNELSAMVLPTIRVRVKPWTPVTDMPPPPTPPWQFADW